jgi:tetratricopeptide (TPR) repeat protein
MATTKKKSGTDAPAPSYPTRPAPEKPRNVAAYEAAVAEFASASEAFARGQLAEAGGRFQALADSMAAEELILSDRARTYAIVCARRLESAPAAEANPDALYHRGIFAVNAGRLDDAWALLDKALDARPGDATVLYARAAVRALQGNAEGAASELRRSVAIDPRLRFQAAADADFDRVRDEAAFIDVIEPTNATRS